MQGLRHSLRRRVRGQTRQLGRAAHADTPGQFRRLRSPEKVPAKEFPKYYLSPQRRKERKGFVLLRPRVQQNPLHPFGGAHVSLKIPRTPPPPSRPFGGEPFN